MASTRPRGGWEEPDVPAGCGPGGLVVLAGSLEPGGPLSSSQGIFVPISPFPRGVDSPRIAALNTEAQGGRDLLVSQAVVEPEHVL